MSIPGEFNGLVPFAVAVMLTSKATAVNLNHTSLNWSPEKNGVAPTLVYCPSVEQYDFTMGNSVAFEGLSLAGACA